MAALEADQFNFALCLSTDILLRFEPITNFHEIAIQKVSLLSGKRLYIGDDISPGTGGIMDQAVAFHLAEEVTACTLPV